MGILDIHNRTENWKTAHTFAPFFKDGGARTRLANQLLQPLGEVNRARGSAIKIELFWKGVRDYVSQQRRESELTKHLADRYNCLFPCLREKLNYTKGFQLKWNHSHYNVTEELEGKFFDNLRNTEIDVVLQTPKYLFIGEAKHESKLRGDGKLILVHQLIRQYVTAKILVDITPSNKQVVPFVIGDSDKLESLRNTTQINFMIDQGWLKEENILSWDCIEELAASTPGNG